MLTKTALLLLLSFSVQGQEQPCKTWYKWREQYDDQNKWEFDQEWRQEQVDSVCSDYAREECCDNLDKCEWMHQSESRFWSDNRNALDTPAACKSASEDGHCVARQFPLGFRPFKLAMFNTDTPCIEVENSKGGLVEILIETDTPSRICVADSANIGNVDRSEGAVLDGQCSDDGRLHACINADTRAGNPDDENAPLRDLRFYVWCDQNCMEYDSEMWIRTQKSAVKWNKNTDKQGQYSAAYYGYAKGGGRCQPTSPNATLEVVTQCRNRINTIAKDTEASCDTGDGLCSYEPLYYKEFGTSVGGCKQRCFAESRCQSYSAGEGQCKLSDRELDLFSHQCDLRNQKWPLEATEKAGWETRSLLDAATGNAEMWCMYEQGLKAKDCLPLVRFPSDLNQRQPAEFVELFLDDSPAAVWGIPTLMLLPTLWIV